MGRLQAEKEEALRREEAMEEDREPILTCHRDDAYNQVKKRSKLETDLTLMNDRQNCVKNTQKNMNNKSNHSSNNRNNSSKVKRNEIKPNDCNNQIRRSPRSPVIIKNRSVSKTRNIGNNCNSKSNHIKRLNTRTVPKTIENGNQTNGSNASNTGRRNR